MSNPLTGEIKALSHQSRTREHADPAGLSPPQELLRDLISSSLENLHLLLNNNSSIVLPHPQVLETMAAMVAGKRKPSNIINITVLTPRIPIHTPPKTANANIKLARLLKPT